MTAREKMAVLFAAATVAWPLAASASMVQGCCMHQGQSVECPAGLPPGSGSKQFVPGGTDWAVPGKGTVFVPQTTFAACTPKPPATSTPPTPTMPTAPTTPTAMPPSKPPTPATTTPSSPSTTTQPTTPTRSTPSTSTPAEPGSSTTTSPSTPRWPVPPVIGPQETDLRARPLNEPDTTGGGVRMKPPGGDAKATEQSMERVKKLREEQDKAHVSVAPAKACGPDVTDYVMAVMQMIEDAYRSWKPAEQSRRCGTLYGLGFNAAWDLQGFTPSDGESYMPQIFFQRAAPNACGIPRDPCGSTVVFLGYCVNAQVVNYVQWGEMNELCDTQERGIAAQAVRSVFNSNSTGQSLMRELGGDFIRTKGDLGFRKDVLKRVMDRRVREEENDWYGMDGTDCPLVCDQSVAAPWLENFSWGFQWGPDDVPITARGSDLKKP